MGEDVLRQITRELCELMPERRDRWLALETRWRRELGGSAYYVKKRPPASAAPAPAPPTD